MAQDSDSKRIAELEADNRRLRRLLDQRDAPGELRHRLRGTLATLRTIIRKSAETERDLDAYVGHLEDRLEALARAQTAADETGVVELHQLFADELLHYEVRENEQASVGGPKVLLRPRAGQVLALAIHELAVNAVEHGTLATGGQVDIRWEIAADEMDALLTIRWTEVGSIEVVDARRAGFGTEVLTRMVAYELEASTDVDFSPDGLRYTLRFPLNKYIGEVDRD